MDLHSRWISLFKDVGAEGDPTKYFRLLRNKYTEPYRHFHNLSHVEHCLGEYDGCKDLLKKPKEVEMAIWFHDLVYDIGSKDNEFKSAELAKRSIKEMSLTNTFGKTVGELIMVTLHKSEPKTSDGMYMADIDVSGLGGKPEVYERGEEGIRKEYASIPDDVFNPGRAQILKSFLSRPSIYYTNWFRNKYENMARQNLERTVARLTI
jgi:predicted metal-dependent HD superfamily phosphohydrolase